MTFSELLEDEVTRKWASFKKGLSKSIPRLYRPPEGEQIDAVGSQKARSLVQSVKHCTSQVTQPRFNRGNRFTEPV